ncbi:cell division protein SepF [Candidatus Termititenax aidoneus]|uniref:Cell division protein SepF n=1 Tax=Termititenax aidoneus TaxID=2218524 RepID=A0A388TBM4_TERA1|nr:cell division protein SepF [Candidatus Termititenax aidoneus]
MNINLKWLGKAIGWVEDDLEENNAESIGGVLQKASGRVTQTAVTDKKPIFRKPLPAGAQTADLLIIEPRNHTEDARKIGEYLKAGYMVLINTKYLDVQMISHLLAFVSGTLAAFDGLIWDIGGGVWLCTPRSVHVVDKQQNDVIFTEEQVADVGAEEPELEPAAATGTYSAQPYSAAYLET